jgi:hypothetical protein
MTKSTSIIIAIACLLIGFTAGSLIFGLTQHKKNSELSENVRHSWYDAVIKATDMASSYYADREIAGDEYYIIYAKGILDGTASAVEEMNSVLMAIDEPVDFLFDMETIKQQMLNSADTKKSLVKSGLVKSAFDTEPGNPVHF